MVSATFELSGLNLTSSTSFDADEQRALAVRSDGEPRRSPFTGRLHQPSDPFHPRNTIVFDDVYHAALAYQHLKDEELICAVMPMSEWVKERDPPVYPAAVAHKLKHYRSHKHRSKHKHTGTSREPSTSTSTAARTS